MYAYISFLLTSKMEEVFNCVDVLQAEPLEAGLERAEAAPPPPAAKQLLEEPEEGERAARDEAEDGQEGEGVDHGRAALVVVGRDGQAAVAVRTRRLRVPRRHGGRGRRLAAAATQGSELRGRAASLAAEPLVRVPRHWHWPNMEDALRGSGRRRHQAMVAVSRRVN